MGSTTWKRGRTGPSSERAREAKSEKRPCSAARHRLQRGVREEHASPCSPACKRVPTIPRKKVAASRSCNATIELRSIPLRRHTGQQWRGKFCSRSPSLPARVPHSGSAANPIGSLPIAVAQVGGGFSPRRDILSARCSPAILRRSVPSGSCRLHSSCSERRRRLGAGDSNQDRVRPSPLRLLRTAGQGHRQLRPALEVMLTVAPPL